MPAVRPVTWLSELSLKDKEAVGMEFAAMGELSRHVPIFDAVIVTPQAYREFEVINALHSKISHIRQSINPQRHDSVMQGNQLISSLIRRAEMPRSIYEQIFLCFQEKSFEKVTVEGYFFYNKQLVERKMVISESTDIEILDHVRGLWARQFEWDFEQNYSRLTEESEVTTVIAIRPSVKAELSGFVEIGSRKFMGHDRIVIEYPHDMSLNEEDRVVIDSYSGYCRRLLGGAFVMHFVRVNGVYIVTTLVEGNERSNSVHHNTHALDGLVINQGVATGRIRHGSDRKGKQRFSHDEIVIFDVLRRSMVKDIVSVKGVVICSPVDRELHPVLRRIGVPIIETRVFLKEAYENGEYVKLNTFAREMRRVSSLH